eukprot:4031332-Amphidinium_carterae.1
MTLGEESSLWSFSSLLKEIFFGLLGCLSCFVLDPTVRKQCAVEEIVVFPKSSPHRSGDPTRQMLEVVFVAKWALHIRLLALHDGAAETQEKIDTIMHLAAQSHVDLSFKEGGLRGLRC